MTTANKVTILRILLIPLFVYEFLDYHHSLREVSRWMCLAAFAAVAILDGVDGFIARRFNQKSELGALLDPLADKLLLMTSVILLSLQSSPFSPLPLWLIALILSRDVLIAIGFGVIVFTCGKANIRPKLLGKTTTVLQISIVLWTLLRFSSRIQLWLAVAVALGTFLSGMQYLYDGFKQLSESPRSAPLPKQ
jgi:CDP-diacylglycerol--glycerol-3-phosphate 3-phosphatidyltransferase